MPEKTQKKSSPIVIGLVILLAVAGATAWTLNRHPSDEANPEVKTKAVVHLESFVVNLSDPNEKAFLRIGLDLGVEKQPTKKEGEAIAELTPSVRDTVLGVLTACRADDLLTVEGKQQLKTRLLAGLKERVPELRVHDIYFTEFLVQR
jgi:flagellar FliL protein